MQMSELFHKLVSWGTSVPAEHAHLPVIPPSHVLIYTGPECPKGQFADLYKEAGILFAEKMGMAHACISREELAKQYRSNYIRNSFENYFSCHGKPSVIFSGVATPGLEAPNAFHVRNIEARRSLFNSMEEFVDNLINEFQNRPLITADTDPEQTTQKQDNRQPSFLLK